MEPFCGIARNVKRALADSYAEMNPLCILSSWTYKIEDTNSSAFTMPCRPQVQKDARGPPALREHSTTKLKASEKDSGQKGRELARRSHQSEDLKDSTSATGEE